MTSYTLLVLIVWEAAFLEVLTSESHQLFYDSEDHEVGFGINEICWDHFSEFLRSTSYNRCFGGGGDALMI